MKSKQFEWIKKLEKVGEGTIYVAKNDNGEISRWIPLYDTTPFTFPVDNRTVLLNEVVFDIDSEDWCLVRDYGNRILKVLRGEKVPYSLGLTGGKGVHISVIFELPEGTIKGNITYRMVREKVFNYVLEKAGIPDKGIIDPAVVSFSDKSKGHLIREFGGRKFNEDKIFYKSTFDEIPDKRIRVRNPEKVRFPDLRIWNIEPEKLREIFGINPVKKDKKKKKILYTSFMNNENRIYEEIIDPLQGPRFAVWEEGKVGYVDEVDKGECLVLPINDDAIKEGAVILPTGVEDYRSIESLINEIKEHIHKYLDISKEYEIFAAYYILLSWVYDKVNTLPYLRALGDTGTGKSRFLDVIGRLCYKPCIVSGSITPAPIYRMIKRWNGTIILDEADFKDSSEKNEVVTILNCGFERGRPVIRCQKDRPDELQFLPTFCPKVFSTRYTFKDKALESRCLTEQLRETDRRDIPPVLPQEFYEEQEQIRKKLLMFRFEWRNRIDVRNAQDLDLGDIEPRLKQATSSFAVLFSNIPELMDRFRKFLRKYNRELIEERANTFEGMVVNSIFALRGKEIEEISASDIVDEMEREFGIKATPQKVGMYLKSLGINSELKRVYDGRKRCIIWDDPLMDKLRKRYVVDVGTTSGELHIDVPNAPLVPDGTTNTTGTSTLKDSRDTFRIIKEIIRERCSQLEIVEYDLVVLDAKEKGISEDTVKDCIDELENKGFVYEPKYGYLKWIE